MRGNRKGKFTRNVSEQRSEVWRIVREMKGALRQLTQSVNQLADLLEAQQTARSSPSQELPPLRMTRRVYETIRRTVGQRPAEHGGLLAGQNGVVTIFHFDHTAHRTGATYSPDTEALNELLKWEWNPRNLRLLGFVHSHPPGVRHPSGGDLVYTRRILDHNPHLDRLLLPIVMAEPDTGRFELLPFGALREGRDIRVAPLRLELTEDDGSPPFDPGETFRRVREAYDLERLARARIIYVGVGGAASFVEEMARAGVGQHVLVDPDVVTESNIATQQVYRKDLGRPKVDCLAERIWDINPEAVVMTWQQALEAIDDATLERLARGPIGGREPEITLLCGLTDNFYAQARVNRLALHFGLPSLCAQVYQEGRGAEITFTYPGITPACHRCALRVRYEAYLEEQYRNTVTSDGTPIFATTRLNTLKGFIALALLHHGTDHPRWGGLLARIGNRNLIQIRMDPDLGLSVFDRVFLPDEQAKAAAWKRERILFDETVWLPQRPDGPQTGLPPCPDCGGTGDLRDAMGTFADTQPMRYRYPEEKSHAPVPAGQ